VTWYRVSFDDALSHAVSARLIVPLCADMAARGHGLTDFTAKYGPDHARALGDNPREIDAWAFDLGGPCYVNAPVETLEVDGLRIDVPCSQFETVSRAVFGARVRRFDSDGSHYYKLKFWMHATVVSLAQYDHITAALTARQSSAIERALAFDAAMRRGREHHG